MNRIYKYIFICFSVFQALAITGCKGDEAVLTPSEPVNNPYAVAPDATGLDAELRRKFFSDHGCYLLFSTELNGSTCGTIDGNEQEDLRWSLTSYYDNQVLTLFETDEEKQQAYDIMENIVLPHLDKSKLPYSILPVKEFYTIFGNGNKNEDVMIRSTFRCTSYNIGELVGLDHEDQEVGFADMVYDMLNDKYGGYSSEMEDFIAVCGDYYKSYCYEIFPDWEYMDENERTEAVREIGFMTYYPDSYGEWDYDEFPYEMTDLRAYWKAVLYSTPEEFYEEWGAYDVIVRKYEIMRRIIAEEVGFIF